MSTETLFNEGDRVQLKNDDMGTWVGDSEAHGAGTQGKIPKNSIGEVMSIHPSTQMPYVFWTGPAKNNRELPPPGLVAYHWPSDLILRNDLPNTPSIRRRVPRA
jgi:hypothetical protein